MALWKKGKSVEDKSAEDDGLQQLRKIYHHPGYLSDEVLKQLDQQFSEGKEMVEGDNNTKNKQNNDLRTPKFSHPADPPFLGEWATDIDKREQYERGDRNLCIYPISLEPPDYFERPIKEPRPCPERDTESWSCFTIAMSPDDNITASQAEHFWLSLDSVSRL